MENTTAGKRSRRNLWWSLAVTEPDVLARDVLARDVVARDDDLQLNKS